MELELKVSSEELQKKFYSLEKPEDISELLEIKYSILVYYLYKLTPPKKYEHFEIKKRYGGVREISSPTKGLKIIQQKLNYILQIVYQPKFVVHGFVPNKNIITNAQIHLKKKFVFNVDLKDFFPSINYGRVRGMFMNIPYNLDPKISTILAQICCFNNQLPQGAPTSPVISNMICAKMDSQLRQFAQKYKCDYTRYADDITISTTRSKFPEEIAKKDIGEHLIVGNELLQLIENNGFSINERKLRLQTRKQRQEVTGLTINQFPNVTRKYIRQIRAMLHSWEKFGLEAAEKEFWEKYDHKHRAKFNKNPSFKKVVKGKITFLSMVKGKNDPIYRKLLVKYAQLDPDFQYTPIKNDIIDSIPRILTEGKTDWKHLKSALQKLRHNGNFTDLEIEFEEYESDIQMGDAELLNICRTYSKTLQPRLTICIFDRDNSEIVRKVTGANGKLYKNWGNNVYSFALPIPDHRSDNSEISIEFYYKDSEIKQSDSVGRRLFINNEFDHVSTRHITEDLVCSDRKKLRKSIAIIDNDVFDKDNKNIALPKGHFAQYILEGESEYKDFDVSEFKKIFSVIEEIVNLIT